MRTDTYLAENGFFKSRTKAKSAIDEGRVFIDGKAVTRASEEYCGGKITVSGGEKYVSRAGLKLEHALECFGMDVRGAVALDIGASTGGFTDCLLQHGAARVYTLDVGSSQLDESLRADSRVIAREGFNARYARKSDFPEEISLIVMDVSFISQTLIYPAAADILGAGKKMITLIKPQFEAGRNRIGKGGIVKDRDGSVIADVLAAIDISAQANGMRRCGLCDSPIKGGDGNREYLALFEKTEKTEP